MLPQIPHYGDVHFIAILASHNLNGWAMMVYLLWSGFILMVLVVTLFLVLAVRKQRELKQFKQARTSIASDLHDEIGAALSSISFYSEACRISIEQNNLQVTVELLGKIGKTSRETIDSMSDIVWVTHPKNDKSERLFERIANFGYERFGHTTTQFYFYTDDEIADMMLPITIRKNLYLICKEALNNTAKYAQANHVELLIKYQKRQLLVVIKDDGIGFVDNRNEDGNGLVNMKVRARQMNAAFNLLTELGKGTSIALSIPLSP